MCQINARPQNTWLARKTSRHDERDVCCWASCWEAPNDAFKARNEGQKSESIFEEISAAELLKLLWSCARLRQTYEARPLDACPSLQGPASLDGIGFEALLELCRAGHAAAEPLQSALWRLSEARAGQLKSQDIRRLAPVLAALPRAFYESRSALLSLSGREGSSSKFFVSAALRWYQNGDELQSKEHTVNQVKLIL